ncbi:plasmid transfer ATPase TraJ [Klebsiella sp. PL-2018]|uniref:plasmid transfer ATPase TraJ n=1 Tax=Klebsiella TaxID=570 RepID=UPI001C235E26|nr:plasmid transfer ATPase TraJ [Klebsiella sp. PL-2018]QXD00981.1 IncI1 plasmid conjugative transfer protein TraJ, related to pilus biogenesis/retracton protein [Klebsiella sp. PL-2018]
MTRPDDKMFPFVRFTAAEFRAFFVWCAAHQVSDVDIVGGSPVSVSRHGRRERMSDRPVPVTSLNPLTDDLFGREVLPRVLSGVPTDRAIQINGDVARTYGLGRGERVRLRAHLIQGTSADEDKVISITLRVIPSEIPPFDSLNIEAALRRGMLPKSGLGFVCGETGSGKSTLLASLYRHCADTQPDRKIVTYEDPVEYIIGREDDLLPPHQAQVGRDVASFADGLRSAMRRNPELIGIGEIRDTETAAAAVQASETGHLCLATMHTHSPGETLPRLLGLFPPEIREAMARAVLGVLRFILVQVLVRTTDGKRRAVREYIVMTPGLQATLSRMPSAQWGYHLDEILRKARRRIVDQVQDMLQAGDVTAEEAALYLTEDDADEA